MLWFWKWDQHVRFFSLDGVDNSPSIQKAEHQEEESKLGSLTGVFIEIRSGWAVTLITSFFGVFLPLNAWEGCLEIDCTWKYNQKWVEPRFLLLKVGKKKSCWVLTISKDDMSDRRIMKRVRAVAWEGVWGPCVFPELWQCWPPALWQCLTSAGCSL